MPWTRADAVAWLTHHTPASQPHRELRVGPRAWSSTLMAMTLNAAALAALLLLRANDPPLLFRFRLTPSKWIPLHASFE